MDAQEPQPAVQQDQAQDAGERVGGADERGDGAGEGVDQVEVEDVDDEEDAGEGEQGGEEGDEAADDHLRRAAGDAEGPAAGDEQRG